MKVFKVGINVNQVATYLLDYPEGTFDLDYLDLTGTSRINNWIPPKVYLDSPQLPVTGFSMLWGSTGNIVVDEVILQKYLSLFESCGELVPLQSKAKRVFLFNCLQVVDAHIGPTPNAFQPNKKFQFIEHRLAGHTLFKLHKGVGLYCVGSDDADCSMYDEVQALLTDKDKGLIIKEVWDSENQ